MPTLFELQKRLKKPGTVQGRLGSEELLIADVRAEMRPGDFVEEKLQAALESDNRGLGARRKAGGPFEGGRR